MLCSESLCWVASLLCLCIKSKDLRQGRLIHDQLTRLQQDKNDLFGNLLLHMYVKCGILEDALAFFRTMPDRDANSWGYIIRVYAHHGQFSSAIHFFNQMHLEGTLPEKPNLTGSLLACLNLKEVDEAHRIHTRIANCESKLDVVVGTVLVDLYSKCCSLKKARSVFDDVFERDTYLWTAVITAYSQVGQGDEAFKLFQQMMVEGTMPDEFTFASLLAACDNNTALKKGMWTHVHIVGRNLDLDVILGNALLSMYGQCSSLDNARNVFDELKEQNVVSWNAMIAAYAQHGQGQDACACFRDMQQKGILPDQVTFISIFDACANQAVLTEGKQAHAYVVGSIFITALNVGNALVNMHGKCGSFKLAQMVFNSMLHRNVITWSALIASYAQQGQAREALKLAPMMELEGVIPNGLTFVSILFACSHAGLVSEGVYYFSLMKHNGIAPSVEHYNCMIDLLARAGLLDEGERLIENMPVRATPALWTTLLGGCRLHFDVNRGKRAAIQALQSDIQEVGPYVLLLNMYATSRLDDGDNFEVWIEEKVLSSSFSDCLIDATEHVCAAEYGLRDSMVSLKDNPTSTVMFCD